MNNIVNKMKFVNFDSSECELGWRFNDTLKANELDEIKAFYRDCFNDFFSPIRTVKVRSFSIAKTTFSWENLFDWEDEELDEVETIEDFCLKINQGLKQYNWRLPTEDEFELACGGHLFSWGNSIPDGIPYGKKTSFSKYKEPNSFGLILNSDTYKSELVDGFLKLGDGGEAVCGGYEWPISWLSLSPSYRYTRIEECFFECLEDAQIRPVLIEI